jgi:predicted SAM-dependent methyltransferase
VRKLLNLGCGTRFHKDWINVDIQSNNEHVIAHDLKKGIPFGDNEFDMVYHSHVLEHIPKNEAQNFLKECVRVLKPGGILRIVIPDLEQITRKYIALLEKGVKSPEDQENWENYQWILIEMYDQTVRTKSGGEMLNFLKKKNIVNQDFIIERCGTEVKNIWEELAKNDANIAQPSFVKKVFWFLKYGQYRMDTIHSFLFPKRHQLFLDARFRNSGEIHQWMYDRYSIKHLMTSLNLKDVKAFGAVDSHLESWSDYRLDNEANGSTYKPDSLFMEGIK